MTKRPYAYDDRCEELAEYFLADDEEPAPPSQIMELAQAIQNAIEDWCRQNSVPIHFPVAPPVSGRAPL